MRKLKIFLLLFVLFISISCTYADGNFTNLQDKVDKSTDTLDITQDYKFNSNEDTNLKEGVLINKSNYVINGNGHTIDGSNQARIFAVTGNNVTINNLVFINGISNGAAINVQGANITIKNSYFANNTAGAGGAIYSSGSAYIKNCLFKDNYAKYGAAIYGSETELEIHNSNFTSSSPINKAMIYSEESPTLMDECIFYNINSNYSSAFFGDKFSLVRNSKFINLYASETAGAIGLKGVNYAVFFNNSFINTSSKKNGGALFIDTLGNDAPGNYTVAINECEFINCKSEFGGALLQLYGILSINNTNFVHNSALSGAAVYTSIVDGVILNTLFENNALADNNMSNGGAIYADLSDLTVYNNHFVNNTKNAIYTYDTDLNLTKTVFIRNGVAVHGVFLDTYYLENNTLGKDLLILNDTDYATIIVEEGAKIVLKDNELNITNLPVKFNLNDFGWVSPVKNQGEKNSCWAFGICGALESALLKATGVLYDFSENNMFSSMIQYSKYGTKKEAENSDPFVAVDYVLNWFGMLPSESDTYDELGKVSSLIASPKNVHVQDVIFIPPHAKYTDSNTIKQAIVDYGALTTFCYSTTDKKYYNNETGALYYYGNESVNHAVTLVGWDDTYSANNFVKKPEGDGAWIIKNSYGTDFANDGYMYISYYDNAFLNYISLAFVINNTENYSKNYQTDLSGKLNLMSFNRTISYKNLYKSLGNDYLSAVGTYFGESGVDYTLKIYVNDNLVLTQSDVSPYSGYHTIILNKTVPLALGDNFTVEMSTKSIPIYERARQHYENNTSFALTDGKWEDLSSSNTTACLKAYTVTLPVFAENLVKFYKNASQFNAYIGEANQTVIFELNGNNYTRTSKNNGIATMNINLRPGEYEIITHYKNASAKNSITVLSTLIGQDLVKYYKNASQFYVSLVDGQGNPVKNTTITMNINGVFYNRTTNENGTAKLNINLPEGTYILTAMDPITNLTMAYIIKVLPTLTGNNITMKYLDGTVFTVKLVDGTGKELSGATITFNINGVFYNRITNASGIAKLNIRLPSGVYIITSQYESAVISNKVTITP